MRIMLLVLSLFLIQTSVGWTDEPITPLLTGSSSQEPKFIASLESTELVGRVGKTTQVRIQLEPQDIPFGHYIVSLAEVTDGPAGPQADILTGYPIIKMTPKVAGDYQIQVRVNLIIKTSCGGAEAKTLLKQMVHLVVSPTTK